MLLNLPKKYQILSKTIKLSKTVEKPKTADIKAVAIEQTKNITKSLKLIK